MIGFAKHAGHYCRSPDFQGLLAACRESPADDTPRLVLADWLAEWPDQSPGAPAGHHAAFLRAQVAPGFVGRRVTVMGHFGSDAPHCMKVWFDDLLTCEPWTGGAPAAACLNASGTGVYYHRGLPEAVKCGVEDLTKAAWILGVWRIPLVCVRVQSNDLGVSRTETPDGTVREEHTWLSMPCSHGVDRWVRTSGHTNSLEVIETLLARAFTEECVGAKFLAVRRERWRGFHPLCPPIEP